MKKALAMSLALIMMIGCLAGCGNNAGETTIEAEVSKTEAANTTTADGSDEATEWFGTEDGKTVTLRFWGGVQPEYGYDTLCANFNEEYKDKGVQVEYVRYVNNAEGNLQLETYLMGGGEVDMFMGYGGRTTLDKRAEANLVLDMADYLEAYGFDLTEELGAANMASYQYDDGSVYAFPTKYENNRWLLINVDMFEAAGVEIPYDGWTYSEFLEAVEKLTYGEGQSKVYGVCWLLNSPSVIKSHLGSVLGAYINYADDDASAVEFDNEVWREGLEMIQSTLVNEWAISLEDEVSENMSVANTFLAGKCAITTSISQMRLCMDLETYPHDFATALVPTPVPDGEEYNTEYYRTHAAVTGAGDLFCIAANTKYPEACFEFAMWYVQGGMSPLVKGGRIPLWTGMDKTLVTQVINENAEGAIDLDSMENYLSIDNTQGVKAVTGAVDSEIGTVWGEEFHALCYGRQTVDETINNLNTRCNELIKNAK